MKSTSDGVDLDAGHLGQVHAAEAVEFGAGIKVGFVALRFFVAASVGAASGCWTKSSLLSKRAISCLDLLVALGDELLVMPPGVQGLLDDEEMFGAPVTVEAAGDGVAAGLDAMIFEGGELLRIALAGEDGLEDGQAGDAGQIADDVVDLEVHLGEGFLQVLDMAAGVTR